TTWDAYLHTQSWDAYPFIQKIHNHHKKIIRMHRNSQNHIQITKIHKNHTTSVGTRIHSYKKFTIIHKKIISSQQILGRVTKNQKNCHIYIYLYIYKEKSIQSKKKQNSSSRTKNTQAFSN